MKIRDIIYKDEITTNTQKTTGDICINEPITNM